METDIGNPIDYDPSIDSLKDDKIEDNTYQREEQQDPYYFQPQMSHHDMMYQNQPQATSNDISGLSPDLCTYLLQNPL